MSADTHPHPNYVKIWGILVVLLVISVSGPMLGIKTVTLITAFGIAGVKAYLVTKHFMHLDVERRYIPYLLLAMVAFMVALFAGVAPDVMRHEGHQWVNVAAKAEVARATQAAHAGHGEAPHAPTAHATAAVATAEALRPTAQPASASEGEATFQRLCSPCHGPNGDGKGPVGVALNPKPANFTDPEFWATRDRAHIEKVIREGGASVGKSPLMAPFGSQLDPATLSKLVDRVLRFNKAGQPR